MQQLYRVYFHISFTLALSMTLCFSNKKIFRVEDDEAGQIPKAYVVRAVSSELSEGQVIKFVADQVCNGSSIFFPQ